MDLLKRVVASEAVPDQPFAVCSIGNGDGTAPMALPDCDDIVIVKRCATRKELVEDVSLFLHEVVGRNGTTVATSAAARDVRSGLEDCKVLIVDDDVRNVFALTSALEQRGVTVLNADDGKEGIEILQAVPDIDMVLMDIMMPELDGYATIRLIRNYPQFKSLPIIAVTAKAMKGDRAKCLDAGASDYISKPVDVAHLVGRLRAWHNR
jgi:CheY-like chemotaxis protein